MLPLPNGQRTRTDSESNAQKSSSEEKCSWGDRLEVRSRAGQSAELPNELHLPPNCSHDDPSLTPEGGGHMVLRKGKVEIGNSGWRVCIHHT